MKQLLCVSVLGLLSTAMGLGQSLETVVFHAVMTTANEVPPTTAEAGGIGTLTFHLTRGSDGAIANGVVDFDVNFNHTAATRFTGLHIHGGPAGVNAGVLIGTNLSAANAVVHEGGAGRVFRQVVVTDGALLGRILNQPDQFYVNIHSAEFGGGVIRGQLARAETLLLRARLSPANEVPPIAGLDASGSATVLLTAVRDGNGEIIGGSALFDVNYRFGTSIEATGLHIHNGPAGVNAGVVIGTDVSARSGISGTSGNITRQVIIATPVQLTNFRGLFVNPSGFYTNLHTTVNAGGAIRGQLQYTGALPMRVLLSPDQEVPPVTGLAASGAAALRTYVTRNAAGRITSGTVVFDVNHQFPGAVEFTGLHIHRAAAGSNGGIVIESGVSPNNSVNSAGGLGNITRLVNIDPDSPAALAALNDLVANPERFYMNLHTRVNPAGVVRGQMGAAEAGGPAINAGGIISAVGDAQIAPASPGTIISIYGRNMAGSTAEASGLEEAALPISLNGTEVRIGSRQAPLFYVSPTQINAQVPYETEPGNVQVFVVRSGDVFSPPTPLAVTPFSPGIFVTSLGAAVLKNANNSLVSTSNPATAGEVLSIFGTGLGRVTPQVRSGDFAPAGPIALTLAQPAVTVGGREAEVLASALSPGFVGLYQVAIRMPAGVAPGNQPVVLTIGGMRSNAAPMAVR